MIRNVRNHNPGNLRISNNDWMGKVPLDQNTDGSFEQFLDYEGQPADFWGLRANMINVLSIYDAGKRTPIDFGNTWAPPSDNGGASDYGLKLATRLGVDPSAVFDVPSNLVDFMKAIVHNEGFWPYSEDIYETAAASALSEKGYT